LAAPGFSGISDEPELVTGSSIVSSPAEDPLVLLEKTRDALSAGDQEGALRELDRFFAVSVENLDEGWFLRGKAYEANGKARDIKKALDSYTTLMAAYPGSSFWKDAEARVRYINRLYLQIR
jgi:outer membrane protein assembly factor BamD (BamD/ComL family)